MERVLSQEEVNALLTTAPGSAAEPTPGPDGITTCDLTGQAGSRWPRLPGLSAVCGRFARGIEDSLSRWIQEVPAVHPEMVRCERFQSFVDSLPVPSSFTVFNLAPLPGEGVLVLEAEAVVHLVGRLFGGGAQTHVKVPGRDFSPVERRLIALLAGRFLCDLGAAWRDITPMDCKPLGMEVHPGLAAIAAPSDMVVCCPLSVELDTDTVRLYAVFPRASLDPLRGRLQLDPAHALAADPVWRGRLLNGALQAPVRTWVDLGETEMSLGRVRDWRPGEVLMLGQSAHRPLSLVVESVPRFSGMPRERDGHLVLEIVGAGGERDVLAGGGS
ncbi:MAG: FliM/FliN family flagellar motor switch protein [Nitrospirota bacterium]|nr:FliM/FliN family flagellar motor switch protein [Nitrospirota bacterium]